MKRAFIMSVMAVVAAIAFNCFSAKAQVRIAYYNLDRVMEEYDMANDLRAAVESKINIIQSELTRRENKLKRDIDEFQNKLEKGLLTISAASEQQNKLQDRQKEYEAYAARKQQEIEEEQQVMLNQILYAIDSYLKKYNDIHHYTLILATSGDILSSPVSVGDPSADITDEIIRGLNEEYIRSR